ncbi:hypothetical protein IWW37_001769 [Coemansia sp. RSA 2050]|nr:hypothetical protein IWW37_001769 [Coemansia sp. RSA 2050]KAJ2735296.1 hypothetical protein IW152_001676 [Coemansia sp. BCRC 34962]
MSPVKRHNETKAAASGDDSRGPRAATAVAMAIGFATSSIMMSAMLQVGPTYLEPIYGNVLAHQWFSSGVVVCMAVGAALGTRHWRGLATAPAAGGSEADARTERAIGAALDVAALLTALAPWRTALLFQESRRLGPMWGPVVTHVSLAAPVAAASGFIAAVSVARLVRSGKAAWAAAYVGAAVAAIWAGRGAGGAYGGCQGLLLVAGYAALSSVMVKLLSRHGRVLLLVAPAAAAAMFCVLTLGSDPRCASGVTARNNAGPAYHMLSRAESVTGWVTVSDEAERQLRVLRSGHSIIGGHWNQTQESIFGIFYYADAVRLVSSRHSNERALIIGLGIGVAARSLHEQGVKVDVVELDPAVYRAAVDFFSLPQDLHGVYLQDGRRFIDDAADASYDFIIHDVFTGGSVPAALFSLSAVAQLNRILAPRGVLAMNYVGTLSDTRTLHHIAHTLRSAFAHVRCFAESVEDPVGVTNMMFFASQEPISFAPGALRRAADPDTIRSRVLAGMEANEVSVAYDEQSVRLITDAWNPLPKWLAPAAQAHWHAMRGMFPDEYWLNY